MRQIAIASSDGKRITGHAGKCRRWLVFDVGEDGVIPEPSRLELPKDLVFHHFRHDFSEEHPHPLMGIEALIAQSSGESFQHKMEKRGVRAIMTAEDAPVAAVRAYLDGNPTPPRPRPIMGLVCKIRDSLSKP
ncbi:MAG: NifB/NifX family molybdenum-iron cluster-binding protein [Magnetovibrionaceae bacterium]